MIQQTSIQAYLNNIDKLGFKQNQVLKVISSKHAVCNQEIAEKLGWAINSVTGRTRELVEAGYVEEAYKDKYPKTNRTVIYWRQVPKYETSLKQYGDE